MKLLYLANIRFPSERAHAAQVAHMCQAFAEAGQEVALVTSSRESGAAGSVEHVFGFAPKFTNDAVPNAWLFKPHSKIRFVLYSCYFALLVLLRHKLKHYDVIYTRDEMVGWCVSWFLSEHKLVWESHEAKYNFFARRLLKKGVKTVCISEAIAEVYKEKGVPETQLLVAHDGIDESFFQPPITQTEARERLGLPLDKKIVMYIGGFDAWKGIETFFNAAALAPNVMFVAIGGREDEIESYQQQYPQVTFLGPKPYKELVYNQQAADVLVVPNSATTPIGAHYTSPLKLFAHMASGVPLVVSKVPSLEVVLKEQGTYFTPDSPESLTVLLSQVEDKDCKTSKLREMAQCYAWKERSRLIASFITNHS